MVRLTLCGAALVGMTACAPSVPYSNPEVFTSTPSQRDAALAQSPYQPVPVGTEPLNTDPAAQPLPDAVISAVNDDAAEIEAARAAASANSGVPPVEASPSNPPPEAVNAAGISAEQDFQAVSAQRSIESDAQRIASNRAQYEVIEPTELPTRPGSNQPNIVAYALQTNNPVGAQLYRRAGLSSAQRHLRNCARYQSPDEAQIDFLSRGGPERDRRGLDPDGDGFACTWDPRPFRAARAAAAAEPAPNIVEPLAISDE